MTLETNETLLLTIASGLLTVLVQTLKDITTQTKQNNGKDLEFPTQIKNLFTPSLAKKCSQMLLRATTAAFSLMARQALASPTP